VLNRFGDLARKPAQHVAFNPLTPSEPDLRRSACELKIKPILLSKASAEKRPLVEALLGSPRDFSMQVAGLFDKALKSTLGHSLREGNKPLFNLVNKLFQSRNKVAHEGQTPDDKLSEYIRAASDVCQWLDRMFPKRLSTPESAL
jgi:hypothetical protein